MKTIKISTEFITIGQFLKFASIISSGGEAKIFLATNKCSVNNEIDNRRGKKLFPGDIIEIENFGAYKIE